MFGTADIDRMPEAFLTDPDAWDVFVGRVWHAVLSPCAIPAAGTVIEIGPGSSAKLAHALAAGGFRGAVHVVEANGGALAALREKYGALLPACRVTYHAKSLADALPDLPRQADLVVGSHILDDFLLFAAAGHTTLFDWASRYSNHVASATRDAWREACARPDGAAPLIGEQADTLAEAFTQLAPAHVVLSQYPSATLADNDLQALNDAAYTVLGRLREKLVNDYTFDDCQPALSRLPHHYNRHIGEHLLNAQYWMKACRK
jgi:hypothetical protein